MSSLTTDQIALNKAWSSVFTGAGMALEWLGDVVPRVAEIADKADALSRDLYRARNLSRSLSRVSTTPMGIGFFGLSQAGKSYLISALAADRDGKLETQLGHAKYDFIRDINPVGGGKEATGLVTRFTRLAAASQDPEFPVEVRLFREIEIAIILANAWFEDFDHQRLDSELSEARIAAVLAPFEAQQLDQPLPGISAEDVVALWDYLEHNYPTAVRPLAARYWPRVLALAPGLNIRERARLFSLLWGGIDEMTATYEQLAGALHRLGLADSLFAPLHALINPRDGSGQGNSIINVDTLGLLGNAAAMQLTVRPCIDGELGHPVSISAPELAALTSELIFRLSNEPTNPVVNKVDLLDFPGYRSRQKLLGLQDAAEINASGQANNPVSRLLLRGKVAYLFERYTNEQEMNALVMCTSTFKQSEVVSVGPVLKSWIDRTQGPTSQQRDGKPSGLLWALTMCDGFVANALNGDDTQFPEACNNMLKLTMVERFGNEPWMKEWGSKPFNNTFLVRKPRFATSFISLDGSNEETGIVEGMRDRLARLKQSFVGSDLVLRHIDQPAEAWDAMLAINDGGINRFSANLTGVADIKFKLKRLHEQLDELLTALLPRLDTYYEAGGEDERARKKLLANMIVKPFATTRHGKSVLGELLAAMALPDDQLRDLYLSAEFDRTEPEDDAIDSDSAAPPENDYDIWGDSPVSEPSTQPVSQALPEYQSHDHRFARSAFDLWVAHLRQLSKRQGLLDLLELPAESIAILTKELVICAERLKLPEQLSKQLLKRAQSGVRREALMQRQVLTTQLLFNDFAAWFGHMAQAIGQRPKGLLGSRQPLFSFYQREMPGAFPELTPQALDQSAIFADDWLSGIAIHTQENAGHRKGKELTIEQNAALGRVLQAFKAS